MSAFYKNTKSIFCILILLFPLIFSACFSTNPIANRYRISDERIYFSLDENGNAKLRFYVGYFDSFADFYPIATNDYDAILNIGGIALHLTNEEWFLLPTKDLEYEQFFGDSKQNKKAIATSDAPISLGKPTPILGIYSTYIVLRAVNRFGKPILRVSANSDAPTIELAVPDYSKTFGLLEIPVRVVYLKKPLLETNQFSVKMLSNWYNDGRE